MIHRIVVAMAMSVGLSACAFNINADVEGLSPARTVYHPFMLGDESPFPFSEAVEVGNLVFLSGQIGSVPNAGDPEAGIPRLAEGGIGPETLQTLKNIEATLERTGLDRHDIVKCTIFMADMAEWPAMNVVYAAFFDEPYPARSAFGTSGLAFNARLEIECIAVRSNGDD